MYKVIVIEDDPFLLQNIEIILEAEGFRAFTAECGKKAIKLIEEIIPDVIVSDIMLPDMDGFEILKHVRMNPEVQDLPFLFLTARTDHKDLRQGMSLGADDYLTKPFNAKELVEAINARLELIKLRGKTNLTHENDNLRAPETVFIKGARGIINLDLKDIVCIQALGEYTSVVVSTGKEHTVKKLLKEWEETLPKDSFIRVHRSAIINIRHIIKIEEWFNHSLRIYLKSLSEPVVSSRRYTSRIKELYFI
ncbi:MAG: response regulator transcription factor [Ignavibacteria bacterium]|jgi:DNA-binding LytR/AlgR family response regulator|nr:response regulator transcription factor [Ignavibacteria bacterium]MCU7505259.1 response regulator transcription factor [Ignavibacteria bacterium]MCU7518505.1 response regulator transcription factor [Ignavibacteria bacterium]